MRASTEYRTTCLTAGTDATSTSTTSTPSTVTSASSIQSMCYCVLNLWLFLEPTSALFLSKDDSMSDFSWLLVKRLLLLLAGGVSPEAHQCASPITTALVVNPVHGSPSLKLQASLVRSTAYSLRPSCKLLLRNQHVSVRSNYCVLGTDTVHWISPAY